MKARYKIGMLVQTKESEGVEATIGSIEGVLTTASGVKYLLADGETQVAEGDIEKVYKEWKQRPRNPNAKPRGSNKTKTENKKAA